MTHEPGRHRRAPPIDADLVEYLIVVVPDLGSLKSIATALAALARANAIRILDLVVVENGRDGAVTVFELEAVGSLSALGDVEGEVGGLLSAHDIRLATATLPRGTTALVLLAEDRWAEPLSIADAVLVARSSQKSASHHAALMRPSVTYSLRLIGARDDEEGRGRATPGEMP